jgi:hypothetical protein
MQGGFDSRPFLCEVITMKEEHMAKKVRVYCIGDSDSPEVYEMYLTKEAWLENYTASYAKALDEYRDTEFDPRKRPEDGGKQFAPPPAELDGYLGGKHGSPVLFSHTWYWEEVKDEGVVLNREDADTVWGLLYNMASQGEWPADLDVPLDVPGTMKRLEEIRLRIETVLFPEDKPYCSDCGMKGERTGHQTCQYPKNHE